MWVNFPHPGIKPVDAEIHAMPSRLPLGRLAFLALAAIMLAGCVVVPARPGYYYRPAPSYYYR